MTRWKFSLVLLWALCFACTAWGETKSLLILHTNDMHDHIRPNYDGVGGLPYVAGHIQQMRETRKDVVVLDAGDVTEKGDLVAFVTKSAIMYEAMERIGYTAAAVGNHDLSTGIPHLRDLLAKAPSVAWVCRNYVDAATGPEPTFLPSKIVNVQGLQVGIIGLTLPKYTKETLDMEGTAKVLAEEVSHLRDQVHLVVVVGHLSSNTCSALSAAVPEVQVFVGGHTHELLTKPIVVRETGALIVQAGEYARYVGHLDLAVDTDTKKVVQFKGEVVELRHDTVPCDTAMVEWVRAREQELCPLATKMIGRTEKELDRNESAKLAVEGMRMSGAKAGIQVDVAFCAPNVVMRGGLPQGALDVNALFRTGGQRGCRLVTIALTGLQIEQYVDHLLNNTEVKTIWSGFQGEIQGDKHTKWAIKTDLDGTRVYHVIMPELEWTSQCKKIVNGHGDSMPSIAPCPFTFTDAFAAYAEEVTAKGRSLDQADVLVGFDTNSR